MSPLWPRTRFPAARFGTSRVCQVSLPGVTDCRHGVSSNEAPVDGVVLGGLSDGDRQARHIGTVALATDGHPIRNGLAAPAQARRAMVNAAGEPLHGEIEIDETWVGGPQPGLRGSRQLKGRKAVLVAVAVEKRANRTGRARMTVILIFRRQPCWRSSRRISRLAQQSIPTVSSSLRVWRRQAINMSRVRNHSVRISARGPSRLCRSPIAPSGIFSSGSSEPTTGSDAISCRSTLTSSSSVIIAERHPRRHFKLCSDLARRTRPPKGTSSAVATIYPNFRSGADLKILLLPESSG